MRSGTGALHVVPVGVWAHVFMGGWEVSAAPGHDQGRAHLKVCMQAWKYVHTCYEVLVFGAQSSRGRQKGAFKGTHGRKSRQVSSKRWPTWLHMDAAVMRP